MSIAAYIPHMHTVARLLTRDSDSARDIVQDVCLKVLEKNIRVDNKQHVGRMVHNHFIDGYRKDKRRKEILLEYAYETPTCTQAIGIRRMQADATLTNIKKSMGMKLVSIADVQAIGIDMEMFTFPLRKRVRLLFRLNGRTVGEYLEKKTTMVKAGEYIIDMYIAKHLPIIHEIITGENRYK